jgi:hypothetical protein
MFVSLNSGCERAVESRDASGQNIEVEGSAPEQGSLHSEERSVWDVRWSVVASDPSGERTTVEAEATLCVTIDTAGIWTLSLLVKNAETEAEDRWQPTDVAAWVRAEVSPAGSITMLELDLDSELRATPALIHLLGDLALVSAPSDVDTSVERTGFGGVGRVRRTEDGWVRSAYSDFLYLPDQQVRVVESRILPDQRQGLVVGFHLRETVVGETGQAHTISAQVTPSTGLAPPAAGHSWHALDAQRPMVDLLQTTQDLERAGDLDGEALLQRLLDVLPHGEVGVASDWIVPVAARLRLSPELAERVAEQTMAHLHTANARGLSRVVDALVASRTPEAERVLRRMFDDPRWINAPDGSAIVQHLALFEGLSVESLNWAVAQAVEHPDPTRRLMGAVIASSAMWSLRSAHRPDVHEAASRLLQAYRALHDPDLQVRWLRVLSNAGEPRFLPLGHEALQSSDEERRAAGYRLFRRVNTPDSLEILLSAASDPSDRALDRALQVLSDHTQFAEQRATVQLRLLQHLDREPVIRWLIAENRNIPLSVTVCTSLLALQGDSAVPATLAESWAGLMENCTAMVGTSDQRFTP